MYKSKQFSTSDLSTTAHVPDFIAAAGSGFATGGVTSASSAASISRILASRAFLLDLLFLFLRATPVTCKGKHGSQGNGAPVTCKGKKLVIEEVTN